MPDWSKSRMSGTFVPAGPSVGTRKSAPATSDVRPAPSDWRIALYEPVAVVAERWAAKTPARVTADWTVATPPAPLVTVHGVSAPLSKPSLRIVTGDGAGDGTSLAVGELDGGPLGGRLAVGARLG